MANVTWVKSGGGNWNNPAAWNGGFVPGADDFVVVSGSFAITYSGIHSVSQLILQTATLGITGGNLTILSSASLAGAVRLSGGQLTLSGGGATMNGNLNQSAGILDLKSGQYNVFGSQSLSGTVMGAGAMVINGGKTTVNAGASLTMGRLEVASGTLSIGSNLSYAHGFTLDGGTLSLNDHTLTLTGSSSFSQSTITSPGTIAVGGNSVLDGLTLGGPTVLSISGTAEQISSINIGNNSTSHASVAITSGGTYVMDGSFELSGGGSGDKLTNAGTFIRGGASGLAEINLTVINTGTMEARSGDVQFLQPVSGAGLIQIDSGALVDFDSTVASATRIGFSGDDGILRLGNSAPSFAGIISGFSGGDMIQLSEFDPTTATKSFNAGTNVLTVSDGDGNTAHLHFAAGLSASSFQLGFGQVGVGIFHT